MSYLLCLNFQNVLQKLLDNSKNWNIHSLVKYSSLETTVCSYFIKLLLLYAVKMNRNSEMCIACFSKSCMNVCVLTSMEQPSSDPLSMALPMMLKRSEGALPSSYISVTPPVKSSKPSDVLPPDRAS